MNQPFFKNAQVYRLSWDLTTTAFDELEQKLEAFRFTPCGSQDMARMGWTSVIPNSEALCHSSGGHLLISALKEEKIIPGTVVKRELDTKLKKLEADKGRKLKKTEKDALKDEVLHSLLPRAFSRFNQTMVWIDTANGLIIVDSAGAKKAEDALALLRKSLGSLPVVPMTIETPIELTITEWVRSGAVPAGFKMMEEAELKAVLDGGGVIRAKQQDLVSDEIAIHIEAGKVATKLALEWQERISFVLSDSFAINRIKFSEELTMQNDDIDHEDIASRFDADFALMTGDTSLLISQLIEALGGEVKH